MAVNLKVHWQFERSDRSLWTAPTMSGVGIQKDTDCEEEKIVLLCDFCRKYNIPDERMKKDFGIDNSHMERITEEAFDNIMSLCKRPSVELSNSLECGAEGTTVGTNVSLSQLFEGDTFTMKMREEEEVAPDKISLVNKGLPTKNMNLLYSEPDSTFTICKTEHELLDSSVPPDNIHNLIISDDDDNGKEHGLLYTSDI